MTAGYAIDQMGLPCIEPEKKCCFRTVFNNCGILSDTNFYDNMCHFRKEFIGGQNMYDKERREARGK